MLRFNLKESVVIFNGSDLYHTNANWTNDRYVIILFNPDFSFHDAQRKLFSLDPRTEELRFQCVDAPSVMKKVKRTAERSRQVDEILRLAAAAQFMNTKQSKYENLPQMLHFGYGVARNHLMRTAHANTYAGVSPGGLEQGNLKNKRMLSKATTQFPDLHGALRRYMDSLVGSEVTAEFASMLFAKNSKCNWHRDRRNVGATLITAIGDYVGGELLINPVRSPKWECIKCKLQSRGITHCRELRKHVAADWPDEHPIFEKSRQNARPAPTCAPACAHASRTAKQRHVETAVATKTKKRYRLP